MSACPWCKGEFPAFKKGDRVKQFCSTACRSLFWSAARRWVGRLLREGHISVDDIKRATAAVHGKDEAA